MNCYRLVSHPLTTRYLLQLRLSRITFDLHLDLITSKIIRSLATNRRLNCEKKPL